MPRPTDPLSFAQRVQRMEPGQTIYFPLVDYGRASIHVSLSRLRSEYRDLMGGTQLPSWSIDIPTPPGDLWAVTYHGLTEDGRAPRQYPTEDTLRERRRVTQNNYRKRRREAADARLAQRAANDPELSAEAPLVCREGLVDELLSFNEEQAKAKEERAAARAAKLNDPNYVPKPRTTVKSLIALENERSRRKVMEMRREERERRRADIERERLARIAARQPKPPSLDQLTERRLDLTVSLDHLGNRLDQLENRLELAREAQSKAKPEHLLSQYQSDRIARGEAKSRYDRAADRIKYYKDRIAKYQAKYDKLEDERELIKEREAELRALQNL